MKFVVPLTIPCRRSTCAAASVSWSTRITGTTPATAASKRSCTSCSRAHVHSSSPCWLRSCLFAVTTWRPAVIARGIEPAHDLDHEVRPPEDVVEVAAAAREDAAQLGPPAGEGRDLGGALG